MKPESFSLESSFQPAGGQPKAIEQLVEGIQKAWRDQVLLGITGSGKTFTMAHVIERLNRPCLILAHNKTLAAQLFMEFRQLFPNNAVEYFVSFYDYYQPEAYVPVTDTYIEKDSTINDTIDKMRHSATRSLLERNDVIIVSSVSCIYGLGSPEAYYGMLLYLEEGDEITRDEMIEKLTQIGYERSQDDFSRGKFRVRGDVIDIFPASEEKVAVRIELFGDYVDRISEIDSISGRRNSKLSKISVYPTTHYITWPESLEKAIHGIRQEMKEQVRELYNQRKVLEAKRLEQRTKFDLEMLQQAGFCSGIENYSRHLTGRKPGEAPYTLLDYFPKNYLMFIDESHVTIPQIRGMYKGDRSRKQTLVDHGFRLPSALDNRPLTFTEFNDRIKQVVYVSATPARYERDQSKGQMVEQIIRPTGLLDPKIEVKPATNQVDHLVEVLREQVQKQERSLVATLTKKSAENLTEYLQSLQFRVRYMHSDVETIERSQILKDLREGAFDILIGINLLREGLDLPEVSLVAILDADKEGFLRSETALLQTCGRAARHINGRVLMYADEITDSIRSCIEITEERRKVQKEFNRKMGITPEAVQSKIHQSLYEYAEASGYIESEALNSLDLEKLSTDVEELEKQKKEAVTNLEFERAAKIRDRIAELKQQAVFEGRKQHV